MAQFYEVRGEPLEEGPIVLIATYPTKGEAEQHPVKLREWRRVWVVGNSDTWPPEKVARLVTAWTVDKLSARAIGVELGITKNAILGKLNRMGLLASAERAAPVRLGAWALLDLRAAQCRYPFGDVRSPEFYFCEADAMSESPYCAEHHELCYLNPETSAKLRAAWTEKRKAAARETIAKNAKRKAA